MGKNLSHSMLRQAVPLTAQAVVICPGVLHPQSPEGVGNELQTIGTIVDQTLNARVIRRRAGILDVVDLEAEPLQPGQMVDELPGNTGQRKLTEQSQHDNSAMGTHINFWKAECRLRNIA